MVEMFIVLVLLLLLFLSAGFDPRKRTIMRKRMI